MLMLSLILAGRSSKAEQASALLEGGSSSGRLEEIQSIVASFSERDAEEFSRLWVIWELEKMQEGGDVVSYSEDDVDFLAQKYFEYSQELYKITGKWSPLGLSVEEIDGLVDEEGVQQVLGEIGLYVDFMKG